MQVCVHSGLGEPRVDTRLFLHLLPPDVMSQGLSMLVRLASLLWEFPSLSSWKLELQAGHHTPPAFTYTLGI